MVARRVWVAVLVAVGLVVPAVPAAALGPEPPAAVVTGAVPWFTDVSTSATFYDEIFWLATTGISTGYADGSFRRLNGVSREAMAAFLYRYAGSPAFTPPTESPFSDVATSATFYTEICWLADQGISTGYPDGTFRRLNAVSREAMAAFLYRFADSPAFTPPADSPFSDVPTSAAFYTEITWLADEGISTGYADGTFRRLNAVSREAMAAFLYRFAGEPAVTFPAGSVWGWGTAASSALGPTTDDSQPAPVQIGGLADDVDQVAGGAVTGYVRTVDGEVWAWGGGTEGQLGDGVAHTSSPDPVQVTGLGVVDQIAAGWLAGYALAADGTVWAWGDNEDGQLGDGSNDDSNTPVQVSGLTGVTQIAAGWYSAYALKDDGTVWSWGWGEWGQLGNDDEASSNVPVQVSGLTDVVDLAAGEAFALALKSDGTVWVWGANYFGQLARALTVDASSVPLQVSGLSGIAEVDACAYTGYARTGSGAVWAWGDNYDGQLGNGAPSTELSITPVAVTGITGATGLGTSGFAAYAVMGDGSVRAWGSNVEGELGDASLADAAFAPVSVLGLNDVVDVDGGYGTTYAAIAVP